MKQFIITVAMALLVSQTARTQGTAYLSNLGQSSSGSNPVGSNSWDAVLFQAGNNASGYTLDSIQLGMADASGNPSDFTVMLYSAIVLAGSFPGSSLGTLDGSLNPTTAGIYTYVPGSSLTLSPNTLYYLVLTAGTAVSNGAYQWDYASSPAYNPSDNWGWGNGLRSSNGTSWSLLGAYPNDYPQFAIDATAIPEPGILGLLGLGGFGFLWHRRKAT